MGKGNHTADTSIYIDYAILGEVERDKANYGWLCESSAIIPNIIEQVTSNIDVYKNKFKYIFTQDMRVVNLDSNFLNLQFHLLCLGFKIKKYMKKANWFLLLGPIRECALVITLDLK